MRPHRALALAALLAAAPAAHAWCVHNQLATRAVRVEQEPHPDKLRAERAFAATLAPGERRCCAARDLDCNPGGRRDSIVRLAITIVGEPEYECGYPEGDEPMVKVTGAGTVRVQANPRYSATAWPYIVRVRAPDKDFTGPRGLQCPQTRPKGTP